MLRLMIQSLKVTAVVVLALTVVFTAQRALSYYMQEAGARAGEPVRFVVADQEPVDSIAERLREAGLIRSSTYFKLRVRLANAEAKLRAGTFTLHDGMTVNQIIDELTTGDGVSTLRVRFQEGWRMEQYAEKLVEVGMISTTDEFMFAASADTWNHDFLASRPSGATLEGYLFPDTYEFRADASPEDVIATMLDTFGARVPPEERAKAEQQGVNFHQAIIIASIVEREAVVPEERPIIASVFYNRLRDGTMTLDADPTVQYAVGEPGNWWPVLTQEHLDRDVPYNTYRRPGLPPGPICNPSLASIQAALNPAETDYLFFVAKGDGSGEHVFATTLEEHNRNVDQYRQRTR